MKNIKTSWEGVSKWYDELTSKSGHYYHENIIYPNLKNLLKTKKANQSLLDLACGAGSLANQLGNNYTYHGVDISKSLVASAKKNKRSADDHHDVIDICTPFDLEKKDFTHASMILAFQNIEKPDVALMNVKKHLKQGGTFILVLNHPCFRIPRQSSWGMDPTKKLQYRRVDSYMSPMDVPIEMNPGKEKSVKTFSFHHSLHDISKYLTDAGFYIASIEEWISDKQSMGKMAKIENRAREEFPLFMTIIAKSL